MLDMRRHTIRRESLRELPRDNAGGLPELQEWPVALQELRRQGLQNSVRGWSGRRRHAPLLPCDRPLPDMRGRHDRPVHEMP